MRHLQMNTNGGKRRLVRWLCLVLSVLALASCSLVQYWVFGDGSTHRQIVTAAGRIEVFGEKNRYLVILLNGDFKVNPDSLKWMFDTDNAPRYADTAYTYIKCEVLPGDRRQRVAISLKTDAAKKMMKLAVAAANAKRLYILPSAFITDGGGKAIDDTIALFLTRKDIVESGVLTRKVNVVETDFYRRQRKSSGIRQVSEKSSGSPWKNVYTYGSDGCLKNAKSLELPFGKLKACRSFVYTYSDSTVCVSAVDSMAPRLNNAVCFVYDRRGLCRKISYYKAEEKDAYMEKHMSWNNDTLACIVCKDSRGVVVSRTYYSYDCWRGTVTESMHYGSEPDAATVTTYTFDSHNRLLSKLVEEAAYDGVTPSGFGMSSSESRKTRVEYGKHDSHGNWRKSYDVTPIGKVLRSKRRIEYYEDEK